MTAPPPATVAAREAAFLAEAARAVAEACRRQLEVAVREAGPAGELPPERPPRRGSAMSCVAPGGRWVLAVGSDELGGLILTRILFAMEIDELPGERDVADAMGEIVNVAVGMLKGLGAVAGLELDLPAYLDGASHGPFAADAPRAVQRLDGDDGLGLEVSVQWRPDPAS